MTTILLLLSYMLSFLVVLHAHMIARNVSSINDLALISSCQSVRSAHHSTYILSLNGLHIYAIFSFIFGFADSKRRLMCYNTNLCSLIFFFFKLSKTRFHFSEKWQLSYEGMANRGTKLNTSTGINEAKC